MIYLYAKETERLDAFDPVFDALGLSMADFRFSGESLRSWHILDSLIGGMKAGDGLCAPSLEQLGGSVDDMIVRVSLVLDRKGLVITVSVPATYEFGLDMRLNHAVIAAVTQGIRSGASGLPFMRRPSAGRPKADFPEGWDELYSGWEGGAVSSKEFLERSGLKKATFYNMIADYRALRDFNARYRAERGLI